MNKEPKIEDCVGLLQQTTEWLDVQINNVLKELAQTDINNKPEVQELNAKLMHLQLKCKLEIKTCNTLVDRVIN